MAAGGAGYLAPSIGGVALAGSCSPDFNIGVIGGNVVWTPVKGFAFTADVNVTFLDQKYSGTFSAGNVAFAKPGGVGVFYEAKDQAKVTGLLRAQRNF